MNSLKQEKLPDFSAVIFDMDGLVLDTESTYCIAWIKASTLMGYEFTEAFCLSMSGLHFQEIEQRLRDYCGTGFDLKQFRQLSESYWRDHVKQHGIEVKKGFFSLLNTLKENNTPYCLATNSRETNVQECLSLANLDDVFSIIVTRDHVKKSKPAPDIFLSAARALDVPVAQCLVLEDSNTGIQAATNAGALSVYIPSVLPFELSTVELADCFLNDLDELAIMIN